MNSLTAGVIAVIVVVALAVVAGILVLVCSVLISILFAYRAKRWN